MRTLTTLAAIALLTAPAAAQDTPAYQALLTPLLQSGTDVLGQPLDFPDDNANVTSAIVTLQPGGATGWHQHEVPLFAYILQGELTVDYGSRGSKLYKAGATFLEAVDWPHNGINTGTVPMRLLAVYMGGGGEANTVALPGP